MKIEETLAIADRLIFRLFRNYFFTGVTFCYIHGFRLFIILPWQEFLPGKRRKVDVQEFGRELTDNIAQLHQELANKTYQNGGYIAFNISDPKPRNIHKASVRDRVLHHAIYRSLYPFFARTFIADSFSC